MITKIMMIFFLYYAAISVTGTLILLLVATVQGRFVSQTADINEITNSLEAAALTTGYILFLVGLVRVKRTNEWKRIVVGLLGIIVGLAIPQIIETCLLVPFKINYAWDEGPTHAVGQLFVFITLPVVIITWFLSRQSQTNK